MKQLQEILAGLTCKIIGETNLQIAQLRTNAQLVEPGDVFIAQRGLKHDGHQFIAQAIANGARVIVCEWHKEPVQSGISYCIVANTAKAAGLLFRNYYPELHELQLVGITGTNGKTTIATLLYQAFCKLGHKCGLISTIKVLIDQQALPAQHTTPDIASLYALLQRMHQAGCRYVFMECSSHAIAQNRIGGLSFAGAVFSNLTPDHLDYHRDFREYIEVKKSFFDKLPSSAFALSNIDDKHGSYVLQNTRAKCYSYALRQMADFQARVVENSLEALTLDSRSIRVTTRLLGYFNAYNLLATYAVCALLLHLEPEQIWLILSELAGAEGRLQLQRYSQPVEFLGIIDYAHNPDGLQQVLETIRAASQGSAKIARRLWVVFGCGGERDRSKRPQMTKIALRYADQLVLTMDNPRGESQAEIFADMTRELESHSARYSLIADRRQAIEYAVANLRAGDILLIAGKGHEKYQEIAGEKYPFDDAQILTELAHKTQS